MRNQFPPSNKCDFCDNKYTQITDDGATLCDKCFKDEAQFCYDCKCRMVFTISIYECEDGNVRCQICEGKYSNV